MIRPVKLEDAASITAIYNKYIKETTATFELEPVDETEMKERIRLINRHYPYLVYEYNNEVIGYCYAHTWKEKAAYIRTAETTVYLHPSYTRKGIGYALMEALIKACKETGIHTLIACITEGNEASISMHKKLGFKQVSGFQEVGYKFGQWLGITDYELILSE